MNNWQRNSVGGGGRTRRVVSDHIFEKIISLNNLFLAWQEFKRGKRKKLDVIEFEFFLEDNIFNLRDELFSRNYRHAPYSSFYVCDPKLRFINKAEVRDRLVHQAIFRVLYHIFDRKFIFDSYSCRLNKGTHRGVDRLAKFIRQSSQNYSKNVFALKCDIRKFFASVDKNILFGLIKKEIEDNNALWLIRVIIDSFELESKTGLPLGNVTSQLFANIYLNELDQFIKRQLKIKYYLRYCDDFIILSNDRDYLLSLIGPINNFLKDKLRLKLHPQKLKIVKLSQGIDFLGYVLFPHYRLLRSKTKKRIVKKFQGRLADYSNRLISLKSLKSSLASYLGVLKPAKSEKIKLIIKKEVDKHKRRP